MEVTFLRTYPVVLARRVKTPFSWSKERYTRSTFWTEGIILILMKIILKSSELADMEDMFKFDVGLKN